MNLEDLRTRCTVNERKILLDSKNQVHAAIRIVSQNNRDKTPILIIPGGPGGDASFYYDHVDLLIDRGPIIFFDPRGTGESDKHLIDSCTLEQHILDLETIRKALEIPKWNLLATSYGGMVGLGYALKFQQNIEKLVLGVTAPSGQFIAKAKRNLKRWGTKKQQTMGLALLEGKVNDDQHFVDIFECLLSLYSIEVAKNPERVKEFPKLKPGLFNYQALNLGYSNFLHQFDFTEELHSIKVPTFIFAGKYDWICDVSFSYLMNQKIPNSHLCVLPGGHNLKLDLPRDYERNLNSVFS